MYSNFLYLPIALLIAASSAAEQQQFPQFQQWTPYQMASIQQQLQQASGDQQSFLTSKAEQPSQQLRHWMPYEVHNTLQHQVDDQQPHQNQHFQQWMTYGKPQTDQQFQPSEYSGGYDFGGQSDSPSYGSSDDSGDDGGHSFGGHNFGGHDLKAHSYPVHQHVHEENPEPIKHYKEVVVPLPKNVEFKINQPVLIPVPHPVPIQVPVPKAVVIPIIKEVSIPVEKSVPYPVPRAVHVPKIKEVPFEVIKHVIVPVEKPVPFKVPVYETIIHTKKGSHKI